MVFWIAAALLSAAAGSVVIWRAASLGSEPAATRVTRLSALAASLAIAALAAGLYLSVGSPGLPDQPFARRLAKWKSSDPSRLTPAQMAMWLKDEARRRPGDPKVWSWLGRAYLAAEDFGDAVEAFEHALRLDPRNAEDWTYLGQSLQALNDGRPSPGSAAAFQSALKLDGKSRIALLALADADLMAGRRQEAQAYLGRLAETFPPNDPNRAAIRQRLAALGNSPMPSAAAAIASAPQDQQRVMIAGMVARLAERLRTAPDDPAGWARLVRAYGVLGQPDRQAQALSQARRLFKSRPQDLAVVEAAAR